MNEVSIFFLFCPHLTAFGSDLDCTHIICSANITYDNGAIVNTAFISNLFGDLKIIGDPDLGKKLNEVNNKNKANLPKYKYPDNIITVSKISYCVEKGVSIKIEKNQLKHCRGLESQKIQNKTIFGAGFLASDKVAAELKAAELKAAELNVKKEVIEWKLSEREKAIIKSLGC